MAFVLCHKHQLGLFRVFSGRAGPVTRKTGIVPTFPAMNTANEKNPRLDNPHTASLIEYPCAFPIKAMGLNAEGFVHAITKIAEQFDPKFDASTIELHASKSAKYLSVTITISATSREQLDNIYRALSSHPMVKLVL
jgi:putative lipoic acid-binding regulatory protein